MTAASVIIASEFWEQVGNPGPYPRNLERAIALTVPVVVVGLANVTVASVRGWLTANRVSVFVPPCPGDMAGCLVAHQGGAVIFVCASDPDDERRVTVAHELAHFLRHYLLPREDAVRALGPAVIPVLDGHRKPTFAERTQAVLAAVRLGAHIHLLPRPDRETAVAIVEGEADELALELIAPRTALLAHLDTLDKVDRSPEVRRVALARHFGVPARCFRPFVPDTRPGQSDPLGHLLTSLRRDT